MKIIEKRAKLYTTRQSALAQVKKAMEQKNEEVPLQESNDNPRLMIEISTEAISSASPEEFMLVREKIRAISKEPHTEPIITVHPKARKNGSKGQYETRCILNKVAMQKIFGTEAEKYELDLGNATRFHMGYDEETGEPTPQKKKYSNANSCRRRAAKRKNNSKIKSIA